MGFKVAVVGATGNVGREMLNILGRAAFSRRRGGGARIPQEHGRRGSFGDKTLKCKTLDHRPHT